MRALNSTKSSFDDSGDVLQKTGEHRNFLFSLGIAILLFAGLSGATYIWDRSGEVLFPAMRYPAFLAVLLIIAGLVNRRFQAPVLHPLAFVLVLFFSFFTDWPCRDFSLLQGPSIRGVIILFAFLSFVIFRGGSKAFFSFMAIAAPLILIGGFFATSQGRLLFSDDHPSMLFRIEMLKENFPFIPFYNPEWNAGFDNRDFFATGILNVFFLFSPLIYLTDVASHYNVIVTLLIFAIVPFAAFLAARIEEMESPAPAIAAILALTSSLLWYRWSLKYGAIGFVTSASLVPLNLVLAAKLLGGSRQFKAWEAVVFVISASLMSFWSLTGVIFLPVLLAGVFRLRTILRKRYGLTVIAALLLINLPWMIAFVSVSSVGRFVTLSKPSFKDSVGTQRSEQHGISMRSIRAGGNENMLKAVREFSVKANPLVVFLVIPGLFFLRSKSTRVLYLMSSAWLLILGTIGPVLKPQLELDRMLVVLSLASSIPVAAIFLWSLKERRVFSASLMSGYLCAAVFSVSGVVYNRSQEQYAFASDLVGELSSAIAENGGGGRTVFSGFILHDFNSGHIAPLVLFSGKPLVASTPFHSVWWYTDVIPASFRERKREGVEQFLDLQNATAVVVRERKWRKYFDSYPERYAPVFRKNGFSVYRRSANASWFIQGDGQLIGQTSSSVTLRLDRTPAVIKFNYFPFLKSSSCSLTPADVGEGVRFIRLENCEPGSVVRIESQNILQRLAGILSEAEES